MDQVELRKEKNPKTKPNQKKKNTGKSGEKIPRKCSRYFPHMCAIIQSKPNQKQIKSELVETNHIGFNRIIGISRWPQNELQVDQIRKQNWIPSEWDQNERF